jgi:hypothetical protein
MARRRSQGRAPSLSPVLTTAMITTGHPGSTGWPAARPLPDDRSCGPRPGWGREPAGAQQAEIGQISRTLSMSNKPSAFLTSAPEPAPAPRAPRRPPAVADPHQLSRAITDSITPTSTATARMSAAPIAVSAATSAARQQHAGQEGSQSPQLQARGVWMKPVYAAMVPASLRGSW